MISCVPIWNSTCGDWIDYVCNVCNVMYVWGLHIPYKKKQKKKKKDTMQVLYITNLTNMSNHHIMTITSQPRIPMLCGTSWHYTDIAEEIDMNDHDAPQPLIVGTPEQQAAIRKFRMEQKAVMQSHVQTAQQALRSLQQDLRKTIPNADGLILSKDIEKAQRQLEKLINGVQILIV